MNTTEKNLGYKINDMVKFWDKDDINCTYGKIVSFTRSGNAKVLSRYGFHYVPVKDLNWD